MLIFLIGMPGSGKTTLGKHIALSLNLSFLDMDERIAHKENQSIEQIFKMKGESYFRKAERLVLEEMTTKTNAIVSTGGGAACFFDNMELMNNTGLTIYLDVPVPVLKKRIFDPEGSLRPMVKGKTESEVEEMLQTKINERKAFYEKAKLVFKGDNIKAEEIISKIRNTTTF